MKLRLDEVRRLTGPNLLWSKPGAIVDVFIDEGDAEQVAQSWQSWLSKLLPEFGWQSESSIYRVHEEGLNMVMSAPMDALYAATELIEASWTATQNMLANKPVADLQTTAAALTEKIAAEHNPTEVTLAQEAQNRGVTFLGHDGAVSLGLGKGSRSYDPDALPAIADVPWDDLHDIPVAMVTGTNGKSTTVRLTAAIGAAAGHCVGLSSSDWVKVDGEILDEGDYSGPAGARLAVRDPRVDLAIIETARGDRPKARQ